MVFPNKQENYEYFFTTETSECKRKGVQLLIQIQQTRQAYVKLHIAEVLPTCISMKAPALPQFPVAYALTTAIAFATLAAYVLELRHKVLKMSKMRPTVA